MTMNLPHLVSNQLFPASPQQSPQDTNTNMNTTTYPSSGKEDAKLKVLVQPNDVQVKRVGRASCIEPDIKLCVEMDTNVPKTIAVNAYLKVLGKDNKHKLILLRKSDDITFTKTHKREVIGMKLRFLKTIKVQVLKRNLGVSRPEASIVFEAVSKQNESEGHASTTNFAIISDPRYLDEVKHRRASERNDQQFSDDEYQPARRVKRRRLDKPGMHIPTSPPITPHPSSHCCLVHLEHIVLHRFRQRQRQRQRKCNDNHPITHTPPYPLPPPLINN